MSEERTKLAQAYEELVPKYQRLVDEVKFALEDRIKTSGVKVASVHGRVKTLDSLLSKVERKEYKDPLADIHDLAGVRVVCQFTPDLVVIAKLIRELFEVHETVDKSSSLEFDKMGYQGTHYIVTLGPNHRGARYDGLAGLKSEIQYERFSRMHGRRLVIASTTSRKLRYPRENGESYTMFPLCLKSHRIFLIELVKRVNVIPKRFERTSQVPQNS
jgi:Region found in RelA / SpoT proteins